MKNTRSVYFCADRIAVITNFADITNVVLNGFTILTKQEFSLEMILKSHACKTGAIKHKGV